MYGRPIRTSLGSEPYGSALVCTGPKIVDNSSSNGPTKKPSKTRLARLLNVDSGKK